MMENKKRTELNEDAREPAVARETRKTPMDQPRTPRSTKNPPRKEYPLLPLRDVVIFPGMVIPLFI